MYHIFTGKDWKIQLAFYTAQIQGGRGRQEDALHTRLYRQGLVVVLADGMGGHARGDEAGSIAANVVLAQLKLDRIPATQSLDDCLLNAFALADTAVLRLGRAEVAKPGSTLIAGIFHPQSAEFHGAYVGDSLCYRLRGSELTKIFTPQLRQGGRSWGIGHGLYRDSQRLAEVIQTQQPPLELRPGDRFLFASDGLELIDLEDIQEYLRLEARDAVERMVVAFIAKKDFHCDNLSVAVVEVFPPDFRS